eukprot:841906-Prorocentrum_minimum.AAC.2
MCIRDRQGVRDLGRVFNSYSRVVETASLPRADPSLVGPRGTDTPLFASLSRLLLPESAERLDEKLVRLGGFDETLGV